MAGRIFTKRFWLLFVGVLGVVLFLLIAVPTVYFGSVYLGGYLRGASIRVNVTPPVAPAATPRDKSAETATANMIPARPVTAIRLVPITSGFNNPVYLTHAFDERLFVVEKAGFIRVVKNGRVLPQPFLDIRDRVGSEGVEQGLFSIAFHPRYAENGRFFVDYTDKEGHSVIAHYQVRDNDPDQANEHSETILLNVGQPFEVHNGGQLQFGPDGHLYVGLGDGGTTGDFFGYAQNPRQLLGTLLRLNIDHGEPYAIPADNPYVHDDAKRNEIWAIGLRNPWRFSFDRLTGDLFIADVGQFGWEEVNFQPADSIGGENYGWDVMEGAHCYENEACDTSSLVLPVTEYSHSEGGCAITGGYIYRGGRFPELTGNYFFADYCAGTIWSLFRQGDEQWIKARVYESDHLISSFGEDAGGELYVLDMKAGAVFQIQP